MTVSNFIYKLWDLKEGGTRIKEMENLKQQQYYSSEQLRQYQQQRLSLLLQHASKHSPWYTSQFHRLNIDISKVERVEDLESFPITKKLDIRCNPDDFLATNYVKDDLVTAKTGGSTGVSLNLFFDMECQKLRNGAQHYADNLASWQPGDKIAALWGNPPEAKTLKEKLRSWLLERTIYLDTMNLNEVSMSAFVHSWRNFKPDILFGHSHSIFIFAKFLLEKKIELESPKGIVATSMMLLESERAIIEKALKVKVTNRYGCEEVGLIACECEKHNGMHINAPHLIVECVDEEGKSVPFGQPGKIVVTDLNNFAMPLIRYQIEDVGVLSDRQCNCGRNFPILDKLEGRVADFLKKEDGSLVGGVSLVERTLTKIPGITQMQIVQSALNAITLNVVPSHDYTTQTSNLLEEEFKDVFGSDVQVTLNQVQRIPQEKSGKYRFSICKI